MSVEFERDAEVRLSFLVDRHGFRLVASDAKHVRYESDLLVAEMWFDPRGEVSLDVMRLDRDPYYGKVEYVGHIGRASLARVISLLAERLEANERALNADQEYFDWLEREQRASSRAYTAWAAHETDVKPPDPPFE